MSAANSAAAHAALPRHEVALLLDGRAWLGWTRLSIERSIDAMAGNFELTLTAREGADLPELPVKPGMACAVALGGETLITGYVDAVDRSIEAESREITIRGRDKAADLVDCSALNKPGSWSKVKLAQVAEELAAPFGVKVNVTGDQGAPLRKFALQQGETAFAAIERLARYRGLIVFSDGKGGVTIGNPDSGLRAGAVSEGGNVLTADRSEDHSQRFSSYVVKGQASGDDERNGKAVAQIKAEVSDAGVTRNRPLLIVGEEQSDLANLRKRAEWEKTTRAGRADGLTVTVPGWFGGDGSASGPVWQPGARCDCRVPSLGVTGERLIERVRLSRDDQGTRSELTLVPPGAWAQLAEAEPAS